MPAIQGMGATLPDDVILDSAVLKIGGAIYGVSSGDITTNLAHTFENVDFDGKIFPIVGLDRRSPGVPFFEGTFIEINATKAADLEPGSTAATVDTVTTITPAAAGDLLPEAAYTEDVSVTVRRGGGGLAAIKFAFALVYGDSVLGKNNAKGEVHLRFEARQAADAANLGVVPYVIEITEPA